MLALFCVIGCGLAGAAAAAEFVLFIPGFPACAPTGKGGWVDAGALPANASPLLLGGNAMGYGI